VLFIDSNSLLWRVRNGGFSEVRAVPFSFFLNKSFPTSPFLGDPDKELCVCVFFYSKENMELNSATTQLHANNQQWVSYYLRKRISTFAYFSDFFVFDACFCLRFAKFVKKISLI
jgi:hypothetical protein